MNLRQGIARIIPKGPIFQSIYEKIYYLSLVGMNYNSFGSFRQSGELSAARYVRRNLKNTNPTLFDVGANTGNYTQLLLNEFPGEHTRIFSFEPMSITFQSLQKRFSDQSNVKLVNSGLGKIKEDHQIYFDSEMSSTASLYERDVAHHGVTLDKKETIQLTTLDIYCVENNINYVDFLKLDVEGNEHNVLTGAKEMLTTKRIAFIQFEFGGTQIDARLFFRDYWKLLNNDYHIYRILQNGLRKITHYHEGLEIFQACNYLAQLKRK